MTAETPRRAFRIPDAEYLPAQAEAEARGETVTDAIRRFLRGYGRKQAFRPTARGSESTEGLIGEEPEPATNGLGLPPP